MYYWIFQLYRKGPQDGVLSDVTEVEVKANTLEEARERVKELHLPEDTRTSRIKAVIVADKH